MLKCHDKFENLEAELVNLQNVLKNSLQKEILEIKKIDKNSDKYKKISIELPQIIGSDYVIYSKFMTKEYHESESFIFIDSTGNTVCTLSGRDLDLYDMIKKCENLVEAKEYK